jgi:hypothetical protein
MGKVMFISERGFVPHAAVNVNQREWYGFKPRLPKSPLSPGLLDRSNLMSKIRYSVTFTIDDGQIGSSIPPVLKQYQSRWYRLGASDCVSFAADLAEALGLKIPRRPNFVPDHFVIGLAALNGKVPG